MNTYANYLAILLPALGASIQWRRARSNVPEGDTFRLAAIFCLVLYVLCYDWTKPPVGLGEWQLAVLEMLVWMVKSFTSVLGGTFVASKVAVYTGGKVAPITNSIP